MATVAASTGPKSVVALAWEMLRANDAKEKRKGKASPEVEKPEVGRQKEQPRRSETYRRLVAAMPCIHCDFQGATQAAHPPPTGKAIKEDDSLCFPLCTLHHVGREIVEGCHKPFDNYELMPKEQMPAAVKKWVRATQEKVIAMGKWPRSWPLPTWAKRKAR